MNTAHLVGILSVAVSIPLFAEPKADRWEKTIAGFERADAKTPPPMGAVVFTGSSSARMWKSLAKDFPSVKSINRGFGGSQISDLIRHAERMVIPYKPKAIVVYSGDNDINSGKTPDRVADDFKKFVDIVHQKLPGTPIGFITIKPSIARWNKVEKMKEANEKIRALCESKDSLTYINIFDPMLGKDGKPIPTLFIKDNLHLSAEGYALWTKAVMPFIQSLQP